MVNMMFEKHKKFHYYPLRQDLVQESNAILNSPSKVWGSLLDARKKERERIELESMKISCCEVENAVRSRNRKIVILIQKVHL